MSFLTREEAKQLILSSQGLASADPFGRGPKGTLKAIEHLGYIQIDTISVVERAHHHVLWSRVSDYNSTILSQLVKEKKVFEFWSHAAAFLPMRDYRFSLPRKRLFATGEHVLFNSNPENKRIKRMILDRIRAEGPLAGRDFEAAPGRKDTGWWNWKPAKLGLEQLFMEGKLMISSRKSFQKIYDLTERVLPSDVDTSFPSADEHARHLVETTLRAHGLARPDEISYLRPKSREAVKKACAKMLKEGLLEELIVEGVKRPYLAFADQWQSQLSTPVESQLKILSPFDNHVIQRKRMIELFDFNYLIECYVPEPKRKFGYFCLPLLEGTRFVGRIDAKAVRERRALTVRALHVETGCGRKAEVWKNAQEHFSDFARFNGCVSVEKGFR